MIERKTLGKYYAILKESQAVPIGSDRININKFKSEDEFDIILKKYNEKKYRFSPYRIIIANEKECYIPTIRDRIVIEYLKDYLKDIYKIEPPNRNTIIKLINKILCSNEEFTVYRFDIKSFFENIKINSILHILKSDCLIDSREYDLLFKCLTQVGHLPRGLPICNILAEIYAKKIDCVIREIFPTRYLYTRYVDDILVIVPNRIKNHIPEDNFNLVKCNLKKLGLSLNTEKSCYAIINSDNAIFEYLGYKYKSYMELKKNKKNKKVEKSKNRVIMLKVSHKKVLKEKRKIDSVFSNYYASISSSRESSWGESFIKRIAFQNLFKDLSRLTRINIVCDGQDVPIYKYGFIYSYMETNRLDDFKNLDKYLCRKIDMYCSSCSSIEIGNLKAISYVKAKQVPRYKKVKYNDFQKINGKNSNYNQIDDDIGDV